MKITLDIPDELSDAVSFCFIGVKKDGTTTIKSAAVLLAGHNDDTLIVEPNKPNYWESEKM